MTKIRIGFIFIACLAVSLPGWANDKCEWPCFHGSDRKNLSDEKGLQKNWPENGPALVLAIEGLGQGYSSVAVVDRRIYTAGMIDNETHVFAIGYDGKILWKKMAGKSWQASERQRWAISYAGSRATPTISGNTVFFMSELGHLVALDAETGEQRWGLNCAETFDAEKPEYGYSESVLVEGDRLFCCPAGRKAYMVALDKNTGEVLWTNAEIQGAAGNSSSVLAEIDGVPQLINLSADRIFAVAPGDGTLLWEYPFANSRSNNCTDVIVHDGLVYASSGYGKGSVLLRPVRLPEKFQVKVVWETELLDNHHGGVVLVDGYLYGAGHKAKGWTCLDFLTGEMKWRRPGKGSLTCADGHLYCLDEKGDMALVRVNPAGNIKIAQFEVPKGGSGAYWAHPVVCGGRLYMRHAEKLYVYDVRKN